MLKKETSGFEKTFRSRVWVFSNPAMAEKSKPPALRVVGGSAFERNQDGSVSQFIGTFFDFTDRFRRLHTERGEKAPESDWQASNSTVVNAAAQC